VDEGATRQILRFEMSDEELRIGKRVEVLRSGKG
jgi:hypothetical protein